MDGPACRETHAYGIIAVRRSPATGELETLLVRRMHSIAMCELFFGTRLRLAPDSLRAICANITADERAVLLTSDITAVLDDLFPEQPPAGHPREAPNRRERRRVRWRRRCIEQRFRTIRASRSLRRAVSRTPCHWEQPEWEFAKGRKDSRHEPDLACAVREFAEETGYAPGDIRVHDPDRVQFHERYVGTNGVPYHHTYYLAFMADDRKPPAYDPRTNKSHYYEISDVRWFPLARALERIRATQAAKRGCLLEATDYLLATTARLDAAAAAAETKTFK